MQKLYDIHNTGYEMSCFYEPRCIRIFTIRILSDLQQAAGTALLYGAVSVQLSLWLEFSDSIRINCTHGRSSYRRVLGRSILRQVLNYHVIN